jgi:hypothetical protein
MLLSHALLAGLILGAGIDVHVKPVTGPSFRAQWVGVDTDALMVLQDGRTQPLPWSGLWEITPVAPAQAPASLTIIRVDLIDGSQLLANRYRVAEGAAQVRLLSGQELEFRTRSIRSVRFRDHAASPELAQQWQQIADARRTGDVIVIRRQESLDYLEGTLADISDDVVGFEFDGDKIEVNRQRLDGVFYYHPLARQLPERICKLTDASGSQWMVRSFSLDDGQIGWTTPAGVRSAVPAEQLGKLDFSSGNTVWLSDLEPESVQYRPYMASRLTAASLERLLGPRRDVGMSGGPLVLDGVTYSRGLAMTSRTEMVFRLTDEFRYFHAMVGIDDAVREAGHVELVISGDDRVLFSRTVTGQEKGFPVELDITGVRRLKILVDYGEQMDIADHLNLCDARLTK